MQSNADLVEKMREHGYLTIDEAARLASRPAATVRRWCREKQVDHIRSGGRWFVMRSSLEAVVKILFQ